MSRYKVLPVPFYFEPDLFMCDTEEEAIQWLLEEPHTSETLKVPPVFNRPGMYCDRKTKKYWVETKYGCWRITEGEFINQLKYISHEEDLLPEKVVDAIEVIQHYMPLPRELKRKLRKHKHARELKSILQEAYRGYYNV
jgi:hypothetical protein